MATESISRNIVLSDEEKVEKFVSALEKASKNPWKPSEQTTKTLSKEELKGLSRIIMK